MSKLSAQLKNNQAYLMYWTIVCALCVGVAACSTDALTGPKKPSENSGCAPSASENVAAGV